MRDHAARPNRLQSLPLLMSVACMFPVDVRVVVVIPSCAFLRCVACCMYDFLHAFSAQGMRNFPVRLVNLINGRQTP